MRISPEIQAPPSCFDNPGKNIELNNFWETVLTKKSFSYIKVHLLGTRHSQATIPGVRDYVFVFDLGN